MITPGRALERVRRACRRLPAESVPLEAAPGRVLARSVRSPFPLPRFDNSAMDGFAVRTRDTSAASTAAPVSLEIRPTIFAGDSAGKLGRGEACRIMTGAPVPRGADGIIPVERAAVCAGHLIVEAPVAHGRHVRRRGEEVRNGAIVARAGSLIHPGMVSTLASVGCDPVDVHAVPRVAVIATGSETVTPGSALREGEIYDSNTPMLIALVRQAGMDPVRVRRVRDHRGALRRAVASALARCDVLVTTGGVSMGERDHLRPVLDDLGVQEVFWRVRQKPGKPLYFGRRGSTLVFGLPGNPASALVCFYVYVYPALRWLAGHSHATLPEAVARVTGRPAGDEKRFQFLRGRAGDDGSVESLSGQGSHMVTALGQCDRLIVVPPGPAPGEGRRLNTLVLPHAMEEDR